MRNSFEKEVEKRLKKVSTGFKYESLYVPYTIQSNYLADFNKGNIIIEVKGQFDQDDRRAMLAVKNQNPHLDIRFVFQKDNYISKQSKSLKEKKKKLLTSKGKGGKLTKDEKEKLNSKRLKYSDWCKKHGFKYYIGTNFPKEFTE